MSLHLTGRGEPKVYVVKTGNANVASVQAGLRRMGAVPILTEDPQTVANAVQVVLPGVGAFGPTRSVLDEKGLTEVIQMRLRKGQPLFAVCLGLQLLLEASEESPNTDGLGYVAGKAQRFPSNVRVPQLGWNYVSAPNDAQYMVSGEYYFANSYRMVEEPEGCLAATADHGGQFIAAFERDGVLACQFHPELSGMVGAQVIQRWLERSERYAC